ncbi:MAG: copper resistance protein CopC [Actinobacteria bacterium]|nr:copper resistance protein CopC [Actinomycetota bacterium]
MRLAIAATLAAATVVALSARAAPAGAHAAVASTDPENGAILDTAPGEIGITFTEPPDLSLTVVGIVDQTGAPVPTGPAEPVPGDELAIRVVPDPLPDGVYTVTWRTVSSTDGHVTSGAFSFGVGVSEGDVTAIPAGDTEQTEPPSPMAVAGRWCLYVGLVVLLGAGVAGLFALGTGVATRPWLLSLAWALAAIGVVLMTFAERSAVGVSLGTLLSSDAGGKLFVLAITVAVAGIAALAAALKPGRVTLAILALGAAGAMLARAASGHAAGSPTAVLIQWVHLIGIGTWIGGLAWLLVGLKRGIEAAQVRRLSRLALIGLVIVVASGVLRASNELGGLGWWLDAFDTSYGTTLVFKLAVVATIITLGALNRFRNVARFEQLGSRPLLRTAGGEVALAAVAFGIAGLLTGLPPQPTEPKEPQATHLTVTGSDFATTTRARLTINPGTVGPNTFLVLLTDYDTGEPIEARRVVLTFDLPERPEVGSELVLDRVEDGGWQAASTALALDGTWTVTVRAEQADGSLEIPLEVMPKVPEPQLDVSEVPGQPTLYTFTLAGGIQLQAYVDPGESGRTNQVHITAFDAEGAELPLHHGFVTATPPGGAPISPLPQRLSKGHFVANLDVDEPGAWTFDLDVLTRRGQTFLLSFEQTFT